jgi:hypothetical protein
MITVPQDLTARDVRAFLAHTADPNNREAIAAGASLVRQLQRLADIPPTAWAAVAAVQGARKGQHAADALQRVAADMTAYIDGLEAFKAAIPTAIAKHREPTADLGIRAAVRLSVALTRSRAAAERIHSRADGGSVDAGMGRVDAMSAAGLTQAEIGRVMIAPVASDTDRREHDVRELKLWSREVEVLRTYMADPDRNPEHLGPLLHLVQGMPAVEPLDLKPEHVGAYEPLDLTTA